MAVPVGKGRRIVIDVEDIALKRALYSALAAEGHSLKDWFTRAAAAYLVARSAPGRPAFGVLQAAEGAATYGAVPGSAKGGRRDKRNRSPKRSRAAAVERRAKPAASRSRAVGSEDPK